MKAYNVYKWRDNETQGEERMPLALSGRSAQTLGPAVTPAVILVLRGLLE